MKRVFSKLVSITLAATMAISCAPAVDLGVIPQLAVTAQAASQVSITAAQGWQEAAWVEWTGDTSGVSGYTVSCDGTAVDDKLIRHYKDGHWRADIVGLAAGTHTITVNAVDSSKKVLASASDSVSVISHDRTGYTFSPSSKFETSDTKACGGYNGDGTKKTDAEVLYITSASDIDTVTDSTGTVGLSTILQGRDKRTSRPLIVRIVGKINYSGSQLNGSGYIQVKPSKAYTNYQTTIEGIGPDTTLNFGFLVKNAGNVEIRNIAVHDFKDDGISLDTDNTDVWVHNCEFFYGVQGSGDKAKGDGSSDLKGDSQYITLSYNHYWDAGKCSLCGMKSETGDNYITYHHNWFDHSDSRHPRIRTMFVHIYNNYFDGNAKYGVGAALDSSAFVESNYFRNCKHPMLTSMQGSDLMGAGGTYNSDNGTFSGENGGVIKAYNNLVYPESGADANERDGGYEPIYYSATAKDGTTHFDAYQVSRRDEDVPSTVKALQGGRSYNNSNSNSSSYIITGINPSTPEQAKTDVEKYAGRTRLSGGAPDFSTSTGFAFTSADDTDYAINSTLRSKLTSYCDNSLSSQYVISTIGGAVDSKFTPETTLSTTTTTTEASTETTTLKPGETTTKESTTETTTAAPVEVDPAVGYVWNYTAGTNTNNFLTVSADDWSSASSNSITYGTDTLTKAKKVGTSSASFTFTAPSAGKLILVTYSSSSGKKVNVNGTGYTVSQKGATTIDITEAGQVKITKGDTNVYLYYLQFVPNDSGIEVSTEVSTEAVSTESTEATTQSADDGVRISYSDGYKFSGKSGTLSTNSSYGGAYYSVTGTAVGDGETKVTLDGTNAVLTDKDTGSTVNLILPTPSMSAGTVTISGTVTPSVLAGSWTPVQVWGVSDGAAVEAAAIRTDSTKIYNLRTGATLTTTNIDATGNVKISYSFKFDFSTNTVELTIGSTTVSNTFTADSISSVRFITAAGSRNLTVGDITVETDGVLMGDVDSDGDVDATDANLVLQYVVGMRAFSDEQKSVADMNQDGKVTAVDSLLIKAAKTTA